MFERATVILAIVAVFCVPAGADPSEATFTPAIDTFNSPVAGPTADNAAGLIGLNQASADHPDITGAGYTIAVIDTGVNPDHPALQGRYVGGYDFVNNNADPWDDHGHGTHVTGIAVAYDDTYGGIAPGAGYAALKVLDAGGSGSFDDIEQALKWVSDNREAHNIVAVNMSMGTSYIFNQTETSRISGEMKTLIDSGVFIACAAGNAWYEHQPDQGVAYPAADPSAVAVGSVWTGNFGRVDWVSGATDFTTGPDRVVSHSNRSTTMLDILAPGAIITSATHDWTEGDPGSYWTEKSGTSMATPAVAGLAVLLRQAIEQNWDPLDWPEDDQWQDAILHIMQESAVTVIDGDDEDDNVHNLNAPFPRIDVSAALNYVVPEPASAVLLAAGAMILLKRRRRR